VSASAFASTDLVKIPRRRLSSGHLDINPIRRKVFSLTDLPKTMADPAKSAKSGVRRYHCKEPWLTKAGFGPEFHGLSGASLTS